MRSGEEEEEGRRKGGEEEGRSRASDIKSNNPHLAGGEQVPTQRAYATYATLHCKTNPISLRPISCRLCSSMFFDSDCDSDCDCMDLPSNDLKM